MRLVVGKKKGAKTDIVEEVEVFSWAALWLADLVLEGLGTEPGITIGDVTGLPGVAGRILAMQESLGSRLGEMQAKNNVEAADQITEQLELWGCDTTPLSHPRVKLGGKLPWNGWLAPSFFAGATPRLLDKLGVPLELFVKAMTNLATGKKAKREYVMNLPCLLSKLSPNDEREEVLAGILAERVPEPGTDWDHWVDYVSQLLDWTSSRKLSAEAVFFARFRRMLAPNLCKLYDAWVETGAHAEAVRLARASEARFSDRLRWQEMAAEDRMALAAFFLAVRSPGKAGGGMNWSLSNRIVLVQQNIRRYEDTNEELLLTLLRLLKTIYYDELRTTSSSKILATCRRQVYWIQPLVARWDLRSTAPKDLATIVVRALVHTFEKAGADGMPYRELLYTVLYALPESKLLKEMGSYSQNPIVTRHLEELVAFVDGIDQRGNLLSREDFKSFTTQVWGESHARQDHRRAPVPTERLVTGQDLLDLVDRLSRIESCTCTVLSDREMGSLRWLVQLQQRWLIMAEARFPDTGKPQVEEELKNEVRVNTYRVVHQFKSQVSAIASAERVLGENGRDPLEVTSAMESYVERVRGLERLCREHLPFAERQLLAVAHNAMCRDTEERVAELRQIVDFENEELAKTALHGKSTADGMDGSTVAIVDQPLVANWMLRRYMLSELAGPDNRIISRLLSWKWVAGWIFLPFVLAALLNLLTRFLPGTSFQWLPGLPFLLVIPANILILVVYARSPARPMGGGMRASLRASLLMPQMVGTLFLGIVQSFAADESWSMAFLGHPFIRLVTMGTFLAASYFFIRHEMLRGQRPKVAALNGELESEYRDREVSEHNRILRNRSLNLLALGLWQAFALVTLFALLQGTVMGGDSRAGLEDAEHANIGTFWQQWGMLVPNVIRVGTPGSGFIGFLIFPWAILSWTAQLFFFSAIFERILARQS
jgi:hypothetical protein